jgi:hypothetical protein
MRKIISRFFLTGLVIATIASCKKEPYKEQTDSKEGAVVYIQQAVTYPQKLNIFPYTDDARSVIFNASFGAVGLPKNNIPVKFEIDNVAFDSVNAIRQQGGLDLYEQFPVDAYAVDGWDVTIRGGDLLSNEITVKYYSKKFDPAKSYLLPISIKDASGYAANPQLNTVFLLANKLEEVKADKTGWSATASSEDVDYGNIASKAIDNNVNTFWHSEWYNALPPYPHWLQVDMKGNIYVTKFALVRRKNNGGGFTKFKLEGSLDGSTWTTLGDNLVFDPTTNNSQYYPVTTTECRYIKLTAVEGVAEYTHLAELDVYRY